MTEIIGEVVAIGHAYMSHDYEIRVYSENIKNNTSYILMTKEDAAKFHIGQKIKITLTPIEER